MVFLGVLSFLQLAIIPGWLITWNWRAPSWLARVLVSFGLSLLFNHLLVLLLVVLGWFDRPVVLGIVGFELLLFLWLLYRNRWRIVPRSITLNMPSDLAEDLVAAPRWLSVGLFWIISLVALSGLIAMFAKVMSVNPGVFNVWDDFTSFNRWALDWYKGIAPSKTQWYPQLISTNWALAYHIIGNGDIQFFVKAVMGLFPLAILFTFFDLFYRSRRVVFLVGLSWTTMLLMALASGFIGSGYVDIPATFLAFLAGAMLLPDLLAKRFEPSHLIMAGILAAGAGLTKQGGLFIILPLLIWVWVIVWANQKNISQAIKWTGAVLLIFGLLVAPWYGYKFWQMRIGQDASEVTSVESALVRAIGERSLVGKWSYGVQSVAIRTSAQLLVDIHLASFNNGRLVSNISNQPISRTTIFTIMWGFIILLGLAVFTPVSGLVTLTVVIPFFLIWATKYSYDFRNLTLALPFLGMAWGFGLIRLFRSLTGWFGQAKPKHTQTSVGRQFVLKINTLPYWVTAVCLMLVGLVVYWQVSYPVTALYAVNEQQMRSVGMQAINDALYQYYETNGLDGKIRTMYQPAAYLPKLKNYVIADGSSLSLESLKQYEQDPEIRYILWWDGTNEPAALSYMNEQIASGKYTAIFNVGDYRFVKIKLE